VGKKTFGGGSYMTPPPPPCTNRVKVIALPTLRLQKQSLLISLLNPIRAVFFYPHFSCVRARDLKFYDFLNNIKTNLVKIFFVKKFIFAATELWQKMVKKGLVAF
jgi:hypothetical protein